MTPERFREDYDPEPDARVEELVDQRRAAARERWVDECEWEAWLAALAQADRAER